MSRFRVVWADDDWEKKPEVRDKELDVALESIDERLREEGIFIDWVRCATAEGALAEIERPDRETRLAILDYRFRTGSEYDWKNIIPALERQSIPFVLFSNVISDMENDPDFPRSHRLFLGPHSKLTTHGRKSFIERIVSFFRSRPIRLLHLTDLHFDASALGADKEEHDRLNAALLKTLEEEQRIRPIDAVMITGDFAAKNPPLDLAAARMRVAAIVQATIGADALDRLFIVPGNHDLTWRNFSKGILEEAPWQAYVDFYQAVYPARVDIWGRMRAWDAPARLLDHRTNGDRLCWRARHADLGLDVIGLVSPAENKALKGRGLISKDQIGFIESSWRGEPRRGEVRIAMTHHNLLKVLSVSAHDENDSIINGGEVLLTLMRNRCGLALSGHTHTPNLFSIHAAHCGGDSLATTGSVNVISAGTTGGFHSARDRVRMFNVLEIGTIDPATDRRPILVRSFFYNSTLGQWRSSGTGFAEPWLAAEGRAR